MAVLGGGIVLAIAALKLESIRRDRFGRADSTPPPALEELPSRSRQLSAIRSGSSSDPFDLIVLGSGATACGVALEAALRGLRVVLACPADFASGSAAAPGLLRGGLRNIESAFFERRVPTQLPDAVRSVRERALISANASYLLSPAPAYLACTKFWEVPLYFVGIKAYSALEWAASVRRPFTSAHWVPLAQLASQYPMLKMDRGKDQANIKGAIAFHEMVLDEARFVLALAMSAASYGALVANHLEPVLFLKSEPESVPESEESGPQRIVGVRVRDALSGEEFDLKAHSVINAGDALCDQIRAMDDPDSPKMSRVDLETNIALPRSLFSPDTSPSCLFFPGSSEPANTYMITNGEFTWLGAGDAELKLKKRDIQVAGSDLRNYISQLESVAPQSEAETALEVARDLTGAFIRPVDLRAGWSHLRAIPRDPVSVETDKKDREKSAAEARAVADTLAAAQSDEAAASETVKDDAATKAGSEPPAATPESRPPPKKKQKRKEHRVAFATEQSSSGLTSVVASRLVWYRQAANAALVQAISFSPKGARQIESGGEELSAHCELFGSHNWNASYFVFLMQTYSTACADVATARHLARTYGDQAWRPAAIAEHSKDKALAARLIPGSSHPMLEAEVIYCARHEMCSTVLDFLLHRSPLARVDMSAAVAAAPRVAQLLGSELGWTTQRIVDETRTAQSFFSPPP
ncbi:Glycerol-3-phosphate dehydrogenase, mitochondrial [Porphyridium purpureum]|uniref:glycerol-3-phosphate dehydrogenase n=1 Tax=Porphyridium purpureum TaxID=35688 RepID=A0A5J4Z1D3_PORPP|nr:Glycerol-3-phosphate dehydrogenase, mitochondrial [Porphyridium purpureum]|eukprot:POR3215..scf208_2